MYKYINTFLKRYQTENSFLHVFLNFSSIFDFFNLSFKSISCSKTRICLKKIIYVHLIVQLYFKVLNSRHLKKTTWLFKEFRTGKYERRSVLFRVINFRFHNIFIL